jgi:DNA-binding NtrC family response regulator
MARYKVLVIDDDMPMREVLCDYLEQSGHEAIPACDCQEANRLMLLSSPDAALLDFTLGDGNAMDLLTKWKHRMPQVPVIILTGHGSIDLAVQSVKLGADQFLTKPAHLSSLLIMLERAIENAQNRNSQPPKNASSNRLRRDPFIGTSSAIRELADLSARVAHSDRSVLIEGETGAGKGVLARWLHDNGPRAGEPYVDLNCVGLSPSLVESEMFGYAKGAFTGAVQPKLGLLETANKGTAFLDEIGDIEVQIQPKLLKALEEKEVRRLGEVKSRRIDIRLISATHQDLKNAIQAKAFRADLYFRINTFTLRIPPLSSRPEDIPALARWFLGTLAEEVGGQPHDITLGTIRALKAYSWPGNIRELKNVLDRAAVLAHRGLITESELEFRDLRSEAMVGDAKDMETLEQDARAMKTLVQLEREHIEAVLAHENGHVDSAAITLGVPRSSLYHKLKRYGIERRDVDRRLFS